MNTQTKPFKIAKDDDGKKLFLVDENNMLVAQVAPATHQDYELPSEPEQFVELLAAAPVLLHRLDKIESLPVDDEGNRIVPPGFLNDIRKYLKLI